jgi:ferredoxin-NADP reductase
VPATEAADVALMQEVRTWLRSLPEQERLTRSRQLASNGDKTALRAMLTAPTYLTGVNEELLALVRDEAAKRAHPERHTKLEAFRKGANVAERAVDGVIRYVEQETGTMSMLPQP